MQSSIEKQEQTALATVVESKYIQADTMQIDAARLEAFLKLACKS